MAVELGPHERPMVAAISQSPTPYYTAILNELSDLVRLHVIYLGQGAKPTRDGPSWTDFRDAWGEPPRFGLSRHRSVPIRLGQLDFHSHISLGVSRQLRRLDPDVVLVHSWGPLMVEPLIWARQTGRAAVMWTESGATTGLVRDPISTAARRGIVALADAYVSAGSRATAYIEALGAVPDRTITSCLPSALAGEIAAAAPARDPGDAEGSGRRFLYVGRLVERKRPIELAHGFIRAVPQLGQSTLTFVGDGPLRPELEALARSSLGRVRILDRAEGLQLAALYLEADVLVVPSVREVWGLVVNEGLAAGLFVVATDEVAAAIDLLEAGSGIVIPADDPERLVDALVLAADSDLSAAARAFRRSLVSRCTPTDFAEAISRAIDLAMSRRPRAMRTRR